MFFFPYSNLAGAFCIILLLIAFRKKLRKVYLFIALVFIACLMADGIRKCSGNHTVADASQTYDFPEYEETGDSIDYKPQERHPSYQAVMETLKSYGMTYTEKEDHFHLIGYEDSAVWANGLACRNGDPDDLVMFSMKLSRNGDSSIWSAESLEIYDPVTKKDIRLL